MVVETVGLMADLSAVVMVDLSVDYLEIDLVA